MQIRTLSSETKWTSPDGQRTIHEVVFEMNGQKGKAQTYSNRIASEGWSGEVVTYKNARGDTFIKQPMQPGGFQPSGQSSASKPSGPPATKEAQQAMYVAYAKDILVALIDSGKADKATYDQYIEWVKEGGDLLYGLRQIATQSTTPDKSTLNDVIPLSGENALVGEMPDDWLKDLPDVNDIPSIKDINEQGQIELS